LEAHAHYIQFLLVDGTSQKCVFEYPKKPHYLFGVDVQLIDNALVYNDKYVYLYFTPLSA
jgi:hypothetical protein